MQPGGKLRRQRGIDLPLPLHPRNANEPRRDNPHIKVGFAARPGTRMSGMVRALIRDAQSLRREGLAEFAPDGIRHTHAHAFACSYGNVKQYVFLFFTRSRP